MLRRSSKKIGTQLNGTLLDGESHATRIHHNTPIEAAGMCNCFFKPANDQNRTHAEED